MGDVPGSDPLDPNIDETMGIASDNEDDTVLEVDSPVHSPINSVRSPSPNGMPVMAEQPETEDDVEEGDVAQADVTSAPVMSRYDRERFEVTHCHHERPNGSQSPYTMRPQNYYDRDYKISPLVQSTLAIHQFLSQSQECLMQPPISSGSSRSDVFVPMLHVRRDLHQKIASRASATVTSGETQAPNFLSSITLKKRPIGSDGEPSQHPIIVRNMMYGIHHRPHSLMKSPEEISISMVPMLSGPPPPEIQHEPPMLGPPTRLPTTLGSPLLMPQQLPQVPVPLTHPVPSSQQSLQSQKVAPPPPKRTGFSIEDIMRR